MPSVSSTDGARPRKALGDLPAPQRNRNYDSNRPSLTATKSPAVFLKTEPENEGRIPSSAAQVQTKRSRFSSPPPSVVKRPRGSPTAPNGVAKRPRVDAAPTQGEDKENAPVTVGVKREAVATGFESGFSSSDDSEDEIETSTVKEEATEDDLEVEEGTSAYEANDSNWVDEALEGLVDDDDGLTKKTGESIRGCPRCEPELHKGKTPPGDEIQLCDVCRKKEREEAKAQGDDQDYTQSQSTENSQSTDASSQTMDASQTTEGSQSSESGSDESEEYSVGSDD